MAEPETKSARALVAELVTEMEPRGESGDDVHNPNNEDDDDEPRWQRWRPRPQPLTVCVRRMKLSASSCGSPVWRERPRRRAPKGGFWESGVTGCLQMSTSRSTQSGLPCASDPIHRLDEENRCRTDCNSERAPALETSGYDIIGDIHGYATPSPSGGGYCRPHNTKNNDQHKGFLAEVGFGSPLHRSIIDWFMEIPL